MLRYVAPSYELAGAGGTASIPGFNPYEVYETALANLDPRSSAARSHATSTRCSRGRSEPLATAEIVALLGDDEPRVRSALAVRAHPIAAGADFYWQAR